MKTQKLYFLVANTTGETSIEITGRKSDLHFTVLGVVLHWTDQDACRCSARGHEGNELAGAAATLAAHHARTTSPTSILTPTAEYATTQLRTMNMCGDVQPRGIPKSISGTTPPGA
ncbi:hypothetical protein EDD11_004945 [Mortierella claussenii]|nr:hypothetical protein EDD11_004945 [Mortierella claussenii]